MIYRRHLLFEYDLIIIISSSLRTDEDMCFFNSMKLIGNSCSTENVMPLDEFNIMYSERDDEEFVNSLMNIHNIMSRMSLTVHMDCLHLFKDIFQL